MMRLPLSSVWYCSVPSGPKKTQLEVPWANNAHGKMRNSIESHSTKENFLIENLLLSIAFCSSDNKQLRVVFHPDESWFHRLKYTGDHAGSFPKQAEVIAPAPNVSKRKIFQKGVVLTLLATTNRAGRPWNLVSLYLSLT